MGSEVNLDSGWPGRMIPKDLCNGHQIRHVLEIAWGEINIAPCLDFRQGLADLRTKFLLGVAVLGQLPESKGQLEDF